MAGSHLLKLPVWMAKRADDVAIGLLIRDELDTALYPAAASCQRLSKHRLGLCLRHEQQEGEPGVGDADVEQLRLGDPPGAMNAQLRRRIATSDQFVGQAHRLKHLERSRLNGEGTRLETRSALRSIMRTDTPQRWREDAASVRPVGPAPTTSTSQERTLP